MNAIAIALKFQNTQFDIVDRNSQPWLRSGQIAQALGYSRPDALNKVYQSNSDEFNESMTALITIPDLNHQNDVAGQMREVRVFSLRGCHLLAMLSRTPIAKDFRVWVLDVLDRQLSNTNNQPHSPKTPTSFAESLRLAADIQEKLEAATLQIEQDKPKIEFAMSVRNMEGTCLVEEFAKAVGWGRNKLFVELRKEHLGRNNLPYQNFIDAGIFVVSEGTPYKDSQGRSQPSFTTRITGKGQVYLEKRLRKVKPLRYGLVDTSVTKPRVNGSDIGASL